MEWLDQIWTQIVNYVNVSYLLSFMLLAWLLKRYFQAWLNKVFKTEVKSVFVVLILATIVAVPYLILGAEWQKVLFSYALGTSLHELVFNWIEDKFTKK